MNFFEFKSELQKQDELAFILPNGISFPAHFHITEIGRTQKQFVDCGGTVRNIGEINIQLWLADDVNHRLNTKKLLQIIQETESKIILPDEEILVELQGETIEKYTLMQSDFGFLLQATQTACLAEDSCGIPKEKIKVVLAPCNRGLCPGRVCA